MFNFLSELEIEGVKVEKSSFRISDPIRKVVFEVFFQV